MYSDDGRIQTCNLLSLNQMRYSVAPRRHFFLKDLTFLLNSDDVRIQTSNLPCCSQMRYSVAPRRHLFLIDLTFFLISDDGRIQTCNLLSRNQMRYSVAPHRLLFFNGANIWRFYVNIQTKNSKFKIIKSNRRITVLI